MQMQGKYLLQNEPKEHQGKKCIFVKSVVFQNFDISWLIQSDKQSKYE